MSGPRVLYVSHNHPALRPGGAEAYAFELYEAMRDRGDCEPLFLARAGQPVSPSDRYHEGTLLAGVDSDPNQYLFFTEFGEFDWLFGTHRNKAVVSRYLRDFLLAQRPDVVHFQHTLFIGYDAIREVKNVLPDVAIVYTLHEFLPICHRQGQMLRVGSEKPCREESPRRCHECFPEIAPQEFFLRKRFIQSHLGLADLFIAPSEFLMERYVDWGIPRERIRVEEYGRRPVEPAPVADRKRRDRLGYFGQLSHYKGVNVLLEAIKRLGDTGASLSVHGANLELQPPEVRDEFEGLLKSCEDRVYFGGEYDHDDLPRLMSDVDWVVVPSIWWENSPLVIQEAFAHGRPVICSDIGGMAEKVEDGVNGLHFRAGSPESLAEVIERAVASPRLWSRLRMRIPPVYDMDQHARSLLALYGELTASASAAGERAKAGTQ
jgi:glycosyltransferase involved in cell wall biosynthesis